MASNKENMRQAMKELLGLVGMSKEEDKGEATFETDLDATRQEVAQTVEKTLFQESPVEITVEPKVEPRKEFIEQNAQYVKNLESYGFVEHVDPAGGKEQGKRKKG